MNIVVVNPYPVHAGAIGGVTRVNAWVRHLARRHQVRVFTHTSGDADADHAAVVDARKAGIEQRIFELPRPSIARRARWMLSQTPYYVNRNRNPTLEATLRQLGRDEEIDVVHVEFAYLWPVIAHLGTARVRVLAEQELMSLAVERLRDVPRPSAYERFIVTQLERIRRFEANVLPCFDQVFGITSGEASRMTAIRGSTCGVMPHVVCTRTFRPPSNPPGGDAILFVGNYRHRPNVHGLRWFTERVWPTVRVEVGSARLLAVGPGLSATDTADLTRAGVTVTGRIDDLVATYQSSAVFVNPIVSGGGMRGKVLEAFASGVPVVSTPLGMEGIEAQHGVHCLHGSNEQDFARSLIAYLRSPALRQQHAAAARELVVDKYDATSVFTKVERVCEEAVALRHAGRPASRTKDKGPVRLSVQIVTWNSADRVDACLGALAAQTSRQFEVVVVDNASSDDSADRVALWLRRGVNGQLIRQRSNTGFCAGQNAAFARAAGDWILFLNPDVILPVDFIERAIDACDACAREVATLAPSIRLPDGRIDSTGLIMDRLRRAWDRDHGLALTDATAREGEVFGCTGAVALHRRSMLDDVAVDRQPLDEGMFAYYDDLDLAWRARLRGWRCEHVPELVATHYREARNALRGRSGRRTRVRDQVLTVRNRLLVLVRCASAGEILETLPLLVAFEALRIGYLAVRAPSALRGYSEFLSQLPLALAARRHIQGRRCDTFIGSSARATAGS